MKRYLAAVAMLLCLQTTGSQGSTDSMGSCEHDHRIIQVAQNQSYIATCSEKDLFVRCRTVMQARRVAAMHARSTGHRTGVIRE